MVLLEQGGPYGAGPYLHQKSTPLVPSVQFYVPNLYHSAPLIVILCVHSFEKDTTVA